MRWLRRIGMVVFVLLVGVTVAAVGYDLSWSSKPARELYPGPFVEVGGTLVAYRVWGVAGTPILLLGGAAEPSWVWHRLGPLLAARHHRVYALDLPPFGYTQRRGPYTLAGWATLVRGFDAKLGLRRPVVVGHSLGAGVAGEVALDDPRSIGGVVFLDGDGLPVGHGIGWFSNLLLYPWYPALYRLATRSDWLVGKVLRNAWGAHRPPITRSILRVFERPFRVDGTLGAFKAVAGHGIQGLSVAELRRLRIRRAVIWGADDHVDEIGAGRATARFLGVPLQIVPDAGHLSMLANPEAVAAKILRSLGLGASPGGA
jgi:pimeloyl-ACP methyl ester carboxylesterase